MGRYLKLMGAAAIAMLALGALGASGASAVQLTGEKSPVTLTGSQHGEKFDKFETTSGEVECEEANYHKTVELPAETVTITPDYRECFFLGSIPAKVDGGTTPKDEGHTCGYLFHLGEEGEPGDFDGTVDVECKNEDEDITVTVELVGTIKCTVHIPQQKGLEGVTFTNVGEGTTREITVDLNITGITYTHTSGTGFGACTGAGEELQHDGTYSGKALITGEEDNETAGHVGIFID